MLLSLRLQRAYEFLEPELVLADVGCDHAFLAIEAVLRSKITKAYAIDNKKEPLKRAEQNIHSAGLENQVFPLLNDGLENLPKDVRQLSICGLGGGLIASILDHEKIKQIQTLVLGTNKDALLIRKKLEELKFQIVGEDIVYEDGVFYELIKAIPGESRLNKRELYFGPILRKTKGEAFILKWKKYLDYLKKIYSTVPKKHQEKRLSLAQEIQLIEEEINGL